MTGGCTCPMHDAEPSRRSDVNNSPTLADAFIRESYRPKYGRVVDPRGALRGMVARARKFVLNEKMSAFMADLSWASLLTCYRQSEAQHLLDSMRIAARLPHEVVWIEYDGRAMARRAREEYNSPVDPELVPGKLGWLCYQHPGCPSASAAVEFGGESWINGKERTFVPFPAPFAYAWQSDDRVLLPWSRLDVGSPSVSAGGQVAVTLDSGPVEAVLTGVGSYRTNKVTIIDSPAPELLKLRLKTKLTNGNDFNPLVEAQGDLRYLWALLATINDLPIAMTKMSASHGYVARGQYRKFVDHSIVTLNVPEKKYRRTAARAIAITRRRAHPVRGHWRKDWRNPGLSLCDHEWAGAEATMSCRLCGRRRLWINEHQRGDAGLGFVTHDYEVRHEQ